LNVTNKKDLAFARLSSEPDRCLDLSFFIQAVKGLLSIMTCCWSAKSKHFRVYISRFHLLKSFTAV